MTFNRNTKVDRNVCDRELPNNYNMGGEQQEIQIYKKPENSTVTKLYLES